MHLGGLAAHGGLGAPAQQVLSEDVHPPPWLALDRTAQSSQKLLDEFPSGKVRDDARHASVGCACRPFNGAIHGLRQAELGLNRSRSCRASSLLPQNPHHRPVRLLKSLAFAGGDRQLNLEADATVCSPIELYGRGAWEIAPYNGGGLWLLLPQLSIRRHLDKANLPSHEHPQPGGRLEPLALLSPSPGCTLNHFNQKRV